MKFLLFLIIALLAFFILGPLALAALTWTAASILGAYILIVGIAMTTGNNSAGSAAVMESFSKDFPNVVIEDRLVEKTSCGFLKLFWCKTFYRILHWPAYSNRPGIQSQPALQWTKRPETSCDDTYNATVSYQGVQPNPCSGPFKGTMCARSFFRPLPDSAIADKAEFAPWKEVMRDKMLMDPATPEFYSEQLSLDNQWIPALNSGFKAGCNWIKGLGKSAAKAEDKFRFFPDFKKYIDSAGTFLPAYQFNQTRINAYKAAIKRYALCGRMTEWGKPMPSLYDCGATMYDGKHPEPTGFGDVFEDEKTAELYANYVYQLHFNWRYMSGNAGIGYPLAYAENYYTALLHNFRLLTTLTIRKGIELDDAYQKYAEDLAVKRSNYQLNNNQYGIKSEKDSRKRVLQNVFYAKLKGLGFPLSAEFSGLPSGGGLTAGGTADQGDAAGTSLSGKELSALNAAKRHANRVAKDNKAWKNFQDQTKDDPDAQRRLAATTNFFGKMNSPLSAVPGMSKPGDNSSYSGIGGKLSGGLGARSGSLSDTDKDKDKESSQKYGPVGDKSSSGAAGGYSAGANGDGSSGFGGNGSPSDGFENSSLGSGGEGDANGAGANGGLSGLGDSSRITGMKEGDLQNMLDSADKDRDKLSSGEADSLFQKVSKAYLRNLDRVLVGKKGRKEVPKAEKKEVRDSEKEEINKIFNQ